MQIHILPVAALAAALWTILKLRHRNNAVKPTDSPKKAAKVDEEEECDPPSKRPASQEPIISPGNEHKIKARRIETPDPADPSVEGVPVVEAAVPEAAAAPAATINTVIADIGEQPVVGNDEEVALVLREEDTPVETHVPAVPAAVPEEKEVLAISFGEKEEENAEKEEENLEVEKTELPEDLLQMNAVAAVQHEDKVEPKVENKVEETDADESVFSSESTSSTTTAMKRQRSITLKRFTSTMKAQMKKLSRNKQQKE